MSDSAPEVLSMREMKALVPDLPPRAELVLVNDRMYKREGQEWCLLGGLGE